MTSACAICLRPICTGEKFLVIATEVAHRACALTGAQTIAQKQTQRIADLGVELATAHRQAQLAKTTAREAATAAHGERQLAIHLRAKIERLSAQLREQEIAHEHQEAQDRRTIARLTADVATLTAAAQRVASTAPVSQTIQTQQAVTEPQLDDTQTRFSLLELD